MPLDWKLLQEFQKMVQKSGKPVITVVLKPPRNNDGRAECWWCKTKTERKPGFTAEYDICPKCGK